MKCEYNPVKRLPSSAKHLEGNCPNEAEFIVGTTVKWRICHPCSMLGPFALRKWVRIEDPEENDVPLMERFFIQLYRKIVLACFQKYQSVPPLEKEWMESLNRAWDEFEGRSPIHAFKLIGAVKVKKIIKLIYLKIEIEFAKVADQNEESVQSVRPSSI